MGNERLEINLDIACHTLASTTKIKRVVNTKESGPYELFSPSNQQRLHRTMVVIKKVGWALRTGSVCVGISDPFW